MPELRSGRGSRWLACCALVGLLATAPGVARADVLPAGTKLIDATFEIENLADFPDYYVVAFPFFDCPAPSGWSFAKEFEVNPHRDQVWHNYEVLQAGRRYDVQKHCGTMSLYAFAKAKFTERHETTAADLDWYRKKGYELTLLEPFDGLKTSEKMIFVDSDDAVRPSGFYVSFPLYLRESAEAKATHDVLRIAAIDARTMRIEGKEVQVQLADGSWVTRPYLGGQRPDVGADPAAEARGREWLEEYERARKELRDGGGGSVWARLYHYRGSVVLGLSFAAVAGGLVVARRRRRRGRRPSRAGDGTA